MEKATGMDSRNVRRIIRNWVLSLGACAFAVLAVFAAIQIRDIIRKKSAPRIEITASAIPFKREITLKDGEAIVLVLPNQKRLAVWCEKPSGFTIHIGESVAALEYGEEPFTPLEREEIVLPSGRTTSGEYRSHIRQGPVMGREYILYVNPYRISLDRLNADSGVRIIASVTPAPEEEQVSQKDEVDYHASRLQNADETVRMNAIFELQELLSSGSTYATPRKPFIIDQLKSLENDPSSQVREQAENSLRTIGDVGSMLKAIQPQPAGRFLDSEEARVLGDQTKECEDPALLAPLYLHVSTFFDSNQENLREFAVCFFGATHPVKKSNPMLLKTLSDPAARVRAAAIHTLENLYDENSRDDDPDNDTQARDQALLMLADPAPEVVMAALETSIYRGGNRQFPFKSVEPFLTSNHNGIRLAAINALLFETSAEAQRVLLDITRDADPAIRAAAAQCLYDANSEAVRNRMILLLEDDDTLVRIRALQALGNNRHPDAIPPIKALLTRDQDPDVIRVAKDALGN